MARIRTIKPEFWKHEGLSSQPEATHMLAAALLNYCDDYGYFNANPRLIESECTPLREPSVSVLESIRRLHEIGYIRLGETPDGRRYGHVVEFATHQRVSHPSESKIKALPIAWLDSGIIPEASLNPPETFRPERNREQGKEQGTGKRKGNARARRAWSLDDEAAIAVYNGVAHAFGWALAQRLSPARLARLRSRISDAGGMDGWSAAMEKARDSPFLNGSGYRNSAFATWRPDIDFFLDESKFTKLMEGSYDKRDPVGLKPTAHDNLGTGFAAFGRVDLSGHGDEHREGTGVGGAPGDGDPERIGSPPPRIGRTDDAT